MPKQKILIYTDGGARGNPGPAGAGWVITDEKGNKIKDGAKYLGHQTNNYAEYQAVILALADLKKKIGREKIKDIEIEIKLDSELVCRQLSGQYQIKEESLFPLFIKIWNARVETFKNLRFTHIPREKNRAADRLSNLAMDSGQKSLL